MKFLFTAVICLILLFTGMAQKPVIVNTQLQLSKSTDSLIVRYDLKGKLPAFNVRLSVNDSVGKVIPARTVTGDIGDNILPGRNKTIIWNMNADNVSLYGSAISVNVLGDLYKPALVKKETWIPWLYIASGASAIVGIYSNAKANSLYDEYVVSGLTDDAEDLHKQVEKFENIRDYAFGAAGLLGAAGVVVHIKHRQKNRYYSVSYNSMPQGAVFGLAYTF